MEGVGMGVSMCVRVLTRYGRSWMPHVVVAIVVLSANPAQAQTIASASGVTSGDILGMPAAGTLPGTSAGAMFGMAVGHQATQRGTNGAPPAARTDLGARFGFAVSIADRLQLDLGFGGRLGLVQSPAGDAMATSSFDGFQPGIRAVVSGRHGGEIGSATALLLQARIPLATLLHKDDPASALVLEPALVFDERRGRGHVGFYLGVPVVMASTGDTVRDVQIEAGIAAAAKILPGFTLALRLQAAASTLAIRTGRPCHDWFQTDAALGAQLDFQRVAVRLYVATDIAPWFEGEVGGVRGGLDLFFRWGDARWDGMIWARNDPPPKPARPPPPKPTAVVTAAPSRPAPAAANAAPSNLFAGPGVPTTGGIDPMEAVRDAGAAIELANKHYLDDAMARRGMQALTEMVTAAALGVVITTAIVAVASYYSLSATLTAKLLQWLGVTALSKYFGEKGSEIDAAFVPFLKTIAFAHGDEEQIKLAAQQYADAVALVCGTVAQALFIAAAAKGFGPIWKQLQDTRFGAWFRVRFAKGADRIRNATAPTVKPKDLRVQVAPDTQPVGGAPYGGGSMTRPVSKARSTQSKPVNLPAEKSITVAMEHIKSGHMAGGTRNTAGKKDVFPEHMDERSVEAAIREAYRSCKRVETQGDRVKLLGDGGGLTIEMWLNLTLKTIETAYPKF